MDLRRADAQMSEDEPCPQLSSSVMKSQGAGVRHYGHRTCSDSHHGDLHLQGQLHSVPAPIES